jgi:hypothetical protein
LIDKSVSAKTALFPAEAGSTGCAVSGMIVPTLRVGMHPVTLCVTLRGLNARCLQDAERPELRHHAERGNEQKQGRRPRSETAAATVGPASAGKPLICSTLLICPKRAFDLDVLAQKAQTPPIATWVQAERRSRGVGRAAWMRRERRQDMDVRSARAHGARPK